MLDFTYENQGTNTYLVYEIKDDDQIDSMSLGMLTNNKIAGFTPTFFTQMDSKRFIKYNVSSKVSVRQFFNGPVNKKRLIGVFEGIINGLLSAEDYMIDISSIVLDLDYIFADVSTCEASLVCLPIENNAPDLNMFFKNIMFSTQFDQTENCDHVAKIINFLNSSMSLSLMDFKTLLESIKGNSQPAPVAAQPVAAAPAGSAQPAVAPVGVAPMPAPASAPAPAPAPVPAPAPAPVPKAKASAKSKAPKNVPVPPVNQPMVPPIPMAQQNGNAKPANQKADNNQQGSEKKMSMFNLLMHYSKENAELYKSQRAAGKGGAQPTQPAEPKQAASKKKAKASATPNFAIPGQVPPAPSAAPQPAVQPVAKAPAQPAPQPVIQQPVQPQVQPAIQQPAIQSNPMPVQQPPFVPIQTPQGQPANFGETTVLGAGGGIGETTVLSASNNPAQQMIAPHLIRKKNNEKISLNKPVYCMGKERSYVDYCISDNSAISRSHANFITRDGQYFVVDTNSTNHTYVNGVMIQSNVETAISHGDSIRLANEEFDFKLY